MTERKPLSAAAEPAVHRAADARTNGTLVHADGARSRLVAESIARTGVELSGHGEYVEFLLTEPADALTVRYSLPDAAGGGGRTSVLVVELDRAERHRLTLTSRYSWYYGAYPFTNDPTAGRAHHFYDDAHLLLGRTCAPGTRVRLRPAAGADVPVVIDVACFEESGGPAPPPENALSALDFGADPTGVLDSTSSLQSAVDAGSAAGRVVWLPPGDYTVTGHLILDRVAVRGAGPWYTALRGAGVGLCTPRAPHPGSKVHISGIAIFGDVTGRDDSAQLNGIGGAPGGGSVLEDLWIAHTKCGIWLDGPFEGLTIRDVRIMNTTADGINLHRGVSQVTVTGCRLHNTGDDGIALWSDELPNHDVTIDSNTVLLPLLGNHIAVYGGHDQRITRNVLTDSVTEGGGIHVANRYGATHLAGQILIEGNRLTRTGSGHPKYRAGVGALWLLADDAPMTAEITVRSNVLQDSAYAAVQLSGSRIDGVHLDGMAIDGAGTCALQLQSSGSAHCARVSASRLGITGVHRPAAEFELRLGPGNEGWTDERRDLPSDGSLRVSATRLDFPATNPQATAGPRSIQIENPGPLPVHVHEIEATGDFTAQPTEPRVIPPGATASFGAVFSPSTTGRRIGVLTVHTDAPRSPLHIDLAGVGFDPAGDRALGRPVQASTAMGGFPPEATVDGTPTTWWQSDGLGFPQWLQVDLEEPVPLTRIVLRTPETWDPRTETVAVEAGRTQFGLRPVLPPAPCHFTPDLMNEVVLRTDCTARFIRLVITHNTAWNGAALSAFEVHGKH
ncbi:glycosyl hydrolase family 28-related protein [Streptomyces sp. NPDC006743]|uniref:glycosyl hydrolase family 28-related protein n=1 Tax=Streptomyces sp. NPDC006743 TaxID=3154480 RepID=UPI003455704E